MLIFFTCIQLYLSKALSRSYFAGDTALSYPILTSTNVTCTPFNFLPRQHTFEFMRLSLYIRCSSCSSWTQLNQEMYIIYMYMKRSNNGIGQGTRLDFQFLFYRYLALNVQQTTPHHIVDMSWFFSQIYIDKYNLQLKALKSVSNGYLQPKQRNNISNAWR